MIIRNATADDLKEIAEVEKECFSAAEAASEKQFSERLAVYPDHFWLLYDRDRLTAVVNGLVTDEEKLRDEMFEKASLHDEKGKWQMLFGVETVPEYRGRGCAGLLIRRVIEDAKKQGRTGIVLTCREKLISFYEKFGFRDEGISGSVHGGGIWHDMRLRF